MIAKKLKELRELSIDDLLKMKADIQSSLRVFRFKRKIERPKNPMEKRNLTRKVGVINTLIREREISQTK